MRNAVITVAVLLLLNSCISTNMYADLYPTGESAGEVTVSQRKWVWFYFIPGQKERWMELENAAVRQIKAEYPGAALADPVVVAKWSPLSLLMYFGYFGFVEDSEMTAQAVYNPVGGASERDRHAIMTSQIYIGMPAEYAVRAIGIPNDVNRTVTARTVHEQWVYESFYVYVENGVVTSWQD